MKLCLRCNQYFDDGIALCPRDNSALEAVGKDPLIGALINDRYVVESVIGKGSSGIVYKATRLMMGREVAVKVLHSYLGADSGSLDRVLREFAAASKLRHPHIITLWEHGITDDQQPYLVMDYLEGITLAELLKEKEYLHSARALPIIEQVCDALDEAHSHGIIHRDIKPENIVLEEIGDEEHYVNDYVKMLDFGIADVPDAKSVQIGKPKTVAGSPAYMSPEQCQGLPLDARSDIYSLAVMVFELLTGERPFRHEEHRALMLAHVTEPPLKLNDVRPDFNFPQQLENVFTKAFAKKPDQRYQTVKEFWNDFKEAMRGYRSTSQPQKAPRKKEMVVDSYEAMPFERLMDAGEPGQVIPWGEETVSPPAPSFSGGNAAARALAMESEGDLWALEPGRMPKSGPMDPESWIKQAPPAASEPLPPNGEPALKTPSANEAASSLPQPSPAASQAQQSMGGLAPPPGVVAGVPAVQPMTTLPQAPVGTTLPMVSGAGVPDAQAVSQAGSQAEPQSRRAPGGVVPGGPQAQRVGPGSSPQIRPGVIPGARGAGTPQPQRIGGSQPQSPGFSAPPAANAAAPPGSAENKASGVLPGQSSAAPGVSTSEAQSSGFPGQAPGTQSGGFPQQAPGTQSGGFPQQAPGT
ncbi:MAG TPA: protein kinase, partial [Candidatus Obscuribacterales bacterium]